MSAPPASACATASPSAAKSADRMLGEIFIPPRPYPSISPTATPPRSRAAPQPDGGEAVGAVAMGEEAHEAFGVGRDGEAPGRVGPPLRAVAGEGGDHVLVLLGLERAGRVDEPPSRLHHRGGGGHDGLLLRLEPVEVVGTP